MAQAPRPTGNGSDFVRKIVADPKNVPDVMLLYGYLGASSEEGHERVYLSPDLGNFVEVPEKAILHRAQAAKEQDPNGGVTLWVKKDAKLSYKMAPAQAAAQQALAYYFAGAIQAGAGGPAPIPPRTPALQCGPQTLPDALCPNTNLPPCPTHAATCVATCHATCAHLCTQVAPCPTHVATCAATCHATCVATCQATCVATCHATCAPACTHVAPCPTHVATCAPNATCVPGCPTHPPHVTCAPICTHVTPCVTKGGPDCPFPTEICTHVAAQCTNAINCVRPQAAAAAMGGVVGAPPSAACSVGCGTANTCAAGCGGITAYATCEPGCWVSFDATCVPDCRVTLDVTCGGCWVTQYATCQPACYVTRNVTCNIHCYVTRACPVVSAACPVPGPGPVEQAQICAVGSVVRPPQATLVCTIEGCQTWHASCWWGCPPQTPRCPW